MTDGTTAREKYADIIDLPHRQSATRQHMSLYDRSAQFAPFAALSGYDDMVAEEARLTDSEIQLSEYESEQMDRKMRQLEDALNAGEHPRVTLTYFQPDERKSGGSYKTIAACIKKLDLLRKAVVLFGSDDLEDRRVSPIVIDTDRIIDIQIDAQTGTHSPFGA